jgi:coatomer protein complex subunit alpha (xenin)
VESDNVKKAKLAVLFAECKLQPEHMFIGYRVAITSQRSVNNFKTAGIYCRKFLELAQTQKVPPHIEGLIPQVRELLMACEREEKDSNALGFEIRSGSQICSGSFGIISLGDSSLKCELCSSSYTAPFQKQLCSTCQLSSVGASVDGSFLSLN